MKIVWRSHSWIITNVWCCENFASSYVWSPSMFLWSLISFEWFLGSFCWNLSELEYIWNVNNVKWIIWFCPWKVNMFFNYLSYIAWGLSLTLTQVFVSRKKVCKKNSCFWKLRWLTSCKMSTTYSCVTYFLRRSFLVVTHFVIPCSGYCFSEGMW